MIYREVVMLGWSKDIIQLYVDFLYEGVINNPLITNEIINSKFQSSAIKWLAQKEYNYL